MAHLENIGDVQWVTEGNFVGTRGQSRRLEGFAIKLTGKLAPQFTVQYMAHLQGIGDSGWFSDGEFCGTRGQSRRVEGIRVRVLRK
ncbi:putative surface protein, responsible for cell interaction [Methanosarcina barkeri 3]|uniref:Surface protein, responsible for cell interaction n=2 Tax=Methanosarcina barkeri TaxID=2208 RepID=A0A0E3WWF1_METBA|nr:putative surface protein, responsible for cell interaction [Methanosarcina barkeri 3]